MRPDLIRTSKYLSRILRHAPESIGLTLDTGGWAEIDDLLSRMRVHGKALSREDLDQLIANNDKKRYSVSPDGRRIRAAQGHSITVELDLPIMTPPIVLFHGTADRNLPSILKDGLKPGRRQHVHLSGDVETARAVGQRHGRPIVLTVSAGAMQADGHAFYRSENGVWLTDVVPPAYLAAG